MLAVNAAALSFARRPHADSRKRFSGSPPPCCSRSASPGETRRRFRPSISSPRSFRSRWPPSRCAIRAPPCSPGGCGTRCSRGLDVAANTAVGVLPLAFRRRSPTTPASRRSGALERSFARCVIAVVALVDLRLAAPSRRPDLRQLGRLPVRRRHDRVAPGCSAGFFAWIVAGWARAGVMSRTRPHGARPLRSRFSSARRTSPPRSARSAFCSPRSSRRRSAGSSAARQFLHARTGLTAAAYARQGFFQMVWVVTLVVPVLVGTRAALRPGKALARRHTLLSLPVIVLLGAIIVLGDAADEDVRALLRPHDGPLLPGRLHALARDRHRVARVHRASRLGTAVRRRRGASRGWRFSSG